MDCNLKKLTNFFQVFSSSVGDLTKKYIISPQLEKPLTPYYFVLGALRAI